MSRRVRPRRRRRPLDEPEGDGSVDRSLSEPVTADDLLDDRAVLGAPDDVARDPTQLVAWAEQHAPNLVQSERDVLAERESRARTLPYRLACREARGLRQAAPDRFEFGL